MATPFLSSEEYDERAHRQYDQGDYENGARYAEGRAAGLPELGRAARRIGLHAFGA